jgi:hypothetical protein
MLRDSFKKFLPAILFMAPGADFSDLQKHSLTSNQHSYTQWSFEKAASSGVEAHQQILDFSQRALKEGATRQIMSDWQVLRMSFELNSADREVFALLAEKLQQNTELCRFVILDPGLVLLLEHPEIMQSCEQKAQALPSKLKNKVGLRELLMIDGKVFRSGDLPLKLMPGIYQWKIISDKYKDQSFQGSATNFAELPAPSEPWVSGTCKNYKLDHPDLSIQLQAMIYFSDDCVVPGIAPEKSLRDWAGDHKPLLWGAGILSFLALSYQLKDKTLVFTKP